MLMKPEFTNGKSKNKKFVSIDTFLDNRSMQGQMVPRAVEKLRKFDVNSEKKLQLEYFFYSNTAEKAERLSNALKNLNYIVYDETPAMTEKLFSITGLTTKMQMSDEVLIQWAKEMCEIGYTFDCEFDGWGTLIDQ